MKTPPNPTIEATRAILEELSLLEQARIHLYARLVWIRWKFFTRR
jgi:hypothetical protein